MSFRIILSLAALAAFTTLLGCSTTDSAGGSEAALTAECINPDQAIIPEAWVCDDPLTVECEDGGADPELIFFPPPEDGPETCEELEDELDYVLNDQGPFEVGTHDIVISVAPDEPEGEPGDVLCATTLTVQDTEAPEGIDEPIELWPPNHKFHTIEGSDCVKDRCDGDDLEVTFLYAISDEPVNDKGDGNTEPDIILECDRVMLRAERQGPSNGRVYRLGWTAVDKAGNSPDPDEIEECIVVVPHDQSGREAVDDGEAYRIEHDDDACDDGAGGAGGQGGDGGHGGAAGDGGQGGGAGDGGAGGEPDPEVP
jgi:uncharacterized membrane protein YgcG